MISVEAVVKRYRGAGAAALDGVDLDVPAGRACALLGDNGAGKTTLVRIVATLLEHDAGRVVVADHDVRSDAAAVRRRVGLVGQYAAVDELLTGRQNLMLFARLRGRSAAAARARAGELLDAFGLVEAADRATSTYSGGMRRRLDLAVGLLDEPSVLMVDEPTTGLDPRSRRELWDQIRARVADGTTVLLTTQYLDEADALADDVVILRDGRVIAAGTPRELKSSVGGLVVDLRLASEADCATAAGVAGAMARGSVERSGDPPRLLVPLAAAGAVGSLCAALEHAGVTIHGIDLRRPTLDDVFLRLHGGHPDPGHARDERAATGFVR